MKWMGFFFCCCWWCFFHCLSPPSKRQIGTKRARAKLTCLSVCLCVRVCVPGRGGAHIPVPGLFWWCWTEREKTFFSKAPIKCLSFLPFNRLIPDGVRLGRCLAPQMKPFAASLLYLPVSLHYLPSVRIPNPPAELYYAAKGLPWLPFFWGLMSTSTAGWCVESWRDSVRERLMVTEKSKNKSRQSFFLQF